ncbi:hypothetical protein B0H14DRAFT_2581784 [Mycena olivaceomarginata]|nr:hypothetical protein B0H14DRAFT_2581784 [Mycena olivaceomarginata]
MQVSVKIGISCWGKRLPANQTSKPFTIFLTSLAVNRIWTDWDKVWSISKTGDAPFDSGFKDSPACDACGAAFETRTHFLLECYANLSIRRLERRKSTAPSTWPDGPGNFKVNVGHIYSSGFRDQPLKAVQICTCEDGILERVFGRFRQHQACLFPLTPRCHAAGRYHGRPKIELRIVPSKEKGGCKRRGADMNPRVKGIHNGGNKISTPAAMDASESMSPNSGKQLNNWPLLAGLVLLLYDYLLTLPTEIRIVVWQAIMKLPPVVDSSGTDGYDIITYGSLLLIYSVHAADYTLAFCSLAILTLHVYALFNRKGVILWLLSLAGMGSLAIGVWLGSAADTTAPLPGSLCMLSHVSESTWAMALSIIFSHLVQFVHPLLILWAEQSHRRRVGGRRDNYRSRLVKCFVLDAAVDVANILSYYLRPLWICGIAQRPFSCAAALHSHSEPIIPPTGSSARL